MGDYAWMVFADFDGTITEQETLEEFLQLLLEEDIRSIGEQMVRKGYTVKQGVQELFGRVTAERYREHTCFFDGLSLRPGFSEFAEVLEERQIPLVVISGGIREMVERNLAPFRKRILDIYAGEADLSSGHVRFWSPYETTEEIVGKRQVMARYQWEHAICIGDSYTDFRMAEAATHVFARDRLASMMKKTGKPYYEYENFYDIINQLPDILEETG